VLFSVELDLFGICTIILPELRILATIVVDAKLDIDTKIGLMPKSIPRN